MKNLLGFSILFLLVLSALGWPAPANSQATEKNPQEEIEEQISRALESGDRDGLAELVKGNRHKVYSMVNHLLDGSIEDELKGNPTLANDKMARAESLAVVYNDIFAEGYLLKRAKLFRSWSMAEKRKKALGDSLLQKGVAEREGSEFQAALDSWTEALKLYGEIGDRICEGRTLYPIGSIHTDTGRYRLALEYFMQALEVNREVGDREGEGRYLSQIGFLYTNLGQYRRALDYHQQSLAVAREIGSPKGEGLGLLNIGVIYHYLEQYEKALDCYRQALQLFQDSGQKRGEGIALNNIGLVYADLDSFQIALEYQRRALELDREIGYRRGEGYVFLQMGGIYYELHQFSQALKDYRRALQIAREIGVPEILWEAQKGVGTALENQGREEEALQFYRQSIATIDSMRGQLGLESLKTHFYAEKIPVYACIVELLAKKGRYEEAFGYAEMVKARALLDVLSQGGLNITEGVAGELLTEKDEIQRRLNQINTRLTQEYAKKEEDRNGELIHALQDSLKWARMAAEELARQIELAHPSYAALTGISRPLSLDQIQKKVLTAEGGPVLVEYLVGDENTHVWAVRGNSLNYECIKVKEKELEDMIKKLRQPFLDFQEGKIYLLTNLPYDLRLAHKLYRLIFQPIESYLGENDPLIIVPDGILHNLPFGSLVTEIREEEVDIQTIFSQYGNAKYLIEKYAISYAPSASVLNPDLQGPPGEGRIDGQLLAFGNPDFGKASQEREEERGFDTSVKVLLRSGQGWVFGQLPKAEEEVVEISEVVGGSASRVFIGKEAKEEIFKEKAAKYRYIHLATHSVLEDREPLYSRIVFALDDDPAEDGFLEAHEIFNLRLNADLVVLSACETGLGELSAGEGLIGLTRAFMYAGAPSVVVSLWTVDGSTCRLMKGFYLNLKNGMTKAEALRQAKIELIGTREEGISYAHPFLWAPFVLVGGWR